MDRIDRTGFTLIELSIVMVIISLIVAGILVGEQLIEVAAMRKIVSEAQQYETAIHTFRIKYNALPGDMANATQLWGTDPLSCVDQIAGTIPRQETCNGDGNGIIGHGGPENLLIWQHLANAGLIAGQYSGKPNGIYYICNDAVGLNIPKSQATYFGGSAGWCWWNINGLGHSPDNRGYEGKYYGATFEFGLGMVGHTDLMPAMTSQQALQIDTKYDDGLPGYGRISAVPNELYCADNWTYDTAHYRNTATDKSCVLLFNVNL